MRIVPAFISLLMATGMAGAAFGADVILKDGQSIATSKPYAVKGKMAILTRVDGSLVSIPVEDIDREKTAAAARAVPEAPAVEATPVPTKRPTTPAEAAQARPGKRASVVLTDADVRGTVEQPDGEKSEKGDGEVSMGPTSETRTKTGYSISGSVVNSGKGDVKGVGVSIEVVGEGNKTLQSTFGRFAKDSLAPGEKATFTAEVETEGEAKKFRYVPSHQITIPVKAAGSGPGGTAAAEAAAAGGGASAKPASPPAEVNPAPGSLSSRTPKSQPAPEPTPQIVPRPDVAPPSASAPVGAPTTPGGAYLPRPSDSQAGSPKTP